MRGERRASRARAAARPSAAGRGTRRARGTRSARRPARAWPSGPCSCGSRVPRDAGRAPRARSPRAACSADGWACSDSGSSAASTFSRNGSRSPQRPATAAPSWPAGSAATTSSSERRRRPRRRPRTGHRGARPATARPPGAAPAPAAEQLGDGGAGSPRVRAHPVAQQLHQASSRRPGRRVAGGAAGGAGREPEVERGELEPQRQHARRSAVSSAVISSAGCEHVGGRRTCPSASAAHRVARGRGDGAAGTPAAARTAPGPGRPGRRRCPRRPRPLAAPVQRGPGHRLRVRGDVATTPACAASTWRGVPGDAGGHVVQAPQQRRALGEAQRQRLRRVDERLVPQVVPLGLRSSSSATMSRSVASSSSVVAAMQAAGERARRSRTAAAPAPAAGSARPGPRPRRPPGPPAARSARRPRRTRRPVDRLGQRLVARRRRCARRRRPAPRPSSALSASTHRHRAAAAEQRGQQLRADRAEPLPGDQHQRARPPGAAGAMPGLLRGLGGGPHLGAGHRGGPQQALGVGVGRAGRVVEQRVVDAPALTASADVPAGRLVASSSSSTGMPSRTRNWRPHAVQVSTSASGSSGVPARSGAWSSDGQARISSSCGSSWTAMLSPPLSGPDDREHLVAQRRHRGLVGRLHVEPQQRLGVGRPHVEPAAVGQLDREPVQLVDARRRRGRRTRP